MKSNGQRFEEAYNRIETLLRRKSTKIEAYRFLKLLQLQLTATPPCVSTRPIYWSTEI